VLLDVGEWVITIIFIMFGFLQMGRRLMLNYERE